MQHKEWFSRGYLPHFDHSGLIQSITFRLADSLPRAMLEQSMHELTRLPEDQRSIEQERRIAEWLDRGLGMCYLRDPRVAELVENALLHFDAQRYRLMAWCVMPNHVHTLVEMREEFPLVSIVHSWKSFTSNAANRLLGSSGEFWMREYHDRFIRNADHFENVKRYIESNPIKAGLLVAIDEWRWSSAWRGRPTPGAPASSRQ
jgi:REP element-mobilizing transposase RayT